MKTCPNCDEDLDEEMVLAGVCESCGEPIEGSDEEDSDLEAEDGSSSVSKDEEDEDDDEEDEEGEEEDEEDDDEEKEEDDEDRPTRRPKRQ